MYSVGEGQVFPRVLSTALLIVVVLSSMGCGGATKTNAFTELFSIPIGFSEHLLFYRGGGDVSRYHSTAIDMRNGLFTVANGFTSRINRYTSYGDAIFSLYNRERNGDRGEPRLAGVPLPIGEPRLAGVPLPIGEPQSLVSRSARPYPFNFITDVAVSSRGVFYVADRIPDLQVAYDQELGSALHTQIVRYDARADTFSVIGQEGVGGTPFPRIHGLHTIDNEGLVVVCDAGDTWLVFGYSAAGKLLYKVAFPTASLPALLVSSDIVEIEVIVPDPHSFRLYVQISYYYRDADVVSRLYWLDLSDGTYEDYIDLTYRAVGDASPYTLIPRFLGVASNSWLVFYSFVSDSTVEVLVMDRDGLVLLRRPVALSDEPILFSDFDLSPEGIISVLLGHEQEARLLWWRLDRELARLTR